MRKELSVAEQVARMQGKFDGEMARYLHQQDRRRSTKGMDKLAREAYLIGFRVGYRKPRVK